MISFCRGGGFGGKAVFLEVIQMAREFAKAFYKSQAWQDCREAYARSQGYLCEVCKRKGIMKAGDTVHHKIHLTPDNINDPAVTLSFANLQLVCRDCHAALHARQKRYKIDDAGRVIVR